MCKQVTTSISERIAKPINFLNSGFDCPIDPPEMFNVIESTGLRIYEEGLYISSLGNLYDNLNILSPYSIAFGQIMSFSTLNCIIVLFLFFQLLTSVFRLPTPILLTLIGYNIFNNEANSVICLSPLSITCTHPLESLSLLLDHTNSPPCVPLSARAKRGKVL